MKTQPKTTVTCRHRRGFTLIEVVVVLILLGILAAFAVKYYIDLTEVARERALSAAIAELNGRESLTWSLLAIENGGPVDDEDVFAAMDFDLGPDFQWDGPVNPLIPNPFNPTQDGGALWFQGVPVNHPDSGDFGLHRRQSGPEGPARWSIVAVP